MYADENSVILIKYYSINLKEIQGGLDVALVENARRNLFHDATEDFKKCDGGGNGDKGGDESVGGEEDEIKEVVRKWDEEGGGKDSNDGKKEAGAESV